MRKFRRPACCFALLVILATSVLQSFPAYGDEENFAADLVPISLGIDQIRALAGKKGFKPYGLNPVLTVGKSHENEWDAGAIGTANVLKVGDVYHLYYEAWGKLTAAGGSSEYDTLQIGHAISLDGIHWIKDPANPIIKKGAAGTWNSSGVWDPFVRYEDGIFKMWYGGNKGDQCEWAYATSKDGVNFEDHGPISELGGVEDIHIAFDPKSKQYRLYYWDRKQADWNEVMKGPPAPSGLFVATSNNETDFDFTKARRLNVDGQLWPSKYTHVLPYGDKWVMFFGEARTRGNVSRTGIAFSDDGLRWTKSAFPIVNGHDAEVIEIAPDLWLMYYGPNKYFDMPECDVRVAIYDGKLDDLTNLPDNDK